MEFISNLQRRWLCSSSKNLQNAKGLKCKIICKYLFKEWCTHFDVIASMQCCTAMYIDDGNDAIKIITLYISEEVSLQ